MIELLELQKKMYDVRWHGAEGDLDQLEREFMAAAEREGIDLEKVNTILGQLYIPPYKEDQLPDHLKKHGGKREGAGRPSLGTTKKVSITLPDESWEQIEKARGERSMSAFLRDIILNGIWV